MTSRSSEELAKVKEYRHTHTQRNSLAAREEELKREGELDEVTY